MAEDKKDVIPAGDPETDKPTHQLSKEELEAQAGEELPDREAMSLINANLAAPVNAAVAANVLSDHSTAGAFADQSNKIDQGIGGTGPATKAPPLPAN
ncbi:MAG TPA: hypothetical protein VJT14_02630 [Candidatus Dormibacteraeota bacterium]|nr:hypothetical protein [Candidatus Dormibacteraeota bacterium]